MTTFKLNFFLLVALSAIFFGTNFSYATTSFDSFQKKQTSYLDFFLLKIENKLINRTKILGAQLFPSRIQYSYIGSSVSYNKKNKKIFINIKAIMDKTRYSKKKYKQKLSDCNIVRNLIFYQKTGYKFFTQKRDPYLSTGIMKDIFIEVFFNNLLLSDDEIEFLLKNMKVKIKIIHPINKTELTCSGNINDYELN